MSLSVSEPAAEPRTLPRSVGRRVLWSVALAALTLGALLIACGPLFVCEPPWVDNTFFDICARTVLEGRALYGEIFLHGPPGMVLVQAALRSVVGWSSEAWAATDLAVVGLVVWLLTRAVHRRRGQTAARLWTAGVLFAFYLSTSEWCHAQPDVWMLLPALLALALRQRQTAALEPVSGGAALERVSSGAALEGGSGRRRVQDFSSPPVYFSSPPVSGNVQAIPPSPACGERVFLFPSPPASGGEGRVRGVIDRHPPPKTGLAAVVSSLTPVPSRPSGWALAEGVCWGVAFVMKPFVAVPALACWLVSAAEGLRLGATARRRLAAQAIWVLAGALAVGALTGLWLWQSGNWPYFITDAAAGAWNQDYYGSSPGWQSRLVKPLLAFWPWGLIHLAAVPEALATLGRTLTASRARLGALVRSNRNSRPLLAALYLGWFAQADFLQRQLIYQLVPGVLLALALLASRRGVVPALAAVARRRRLRWMPAGWFLAVAVGWLALFVWLAPQRELLKDEHWLAGFVALTRQEGWFLVPALLTVGAVCASPTLRRSVAGAARVGVVRGLAGVVLLAWAVAQNPLLVPERLAWWRVCWAQGSTPGVRNALTVEWDTAAPDWLALEAVKGYLAGQQVRDRELTCYAVSSVPLYKELDVAPSTRFVLLWPALYFFKGHKDEILRAVRDSPQRFIVGDLVQDGFSRREALEDYPRPFGLPPLPVRLQRQFPWVEPVAFRAGRYVVHRVKDPRPATAHP